MKRYIFTFAFSLAFLAPTLAWAQPGIPHQFYGTIEFANGPTPAGLTVEVKVGGATVGTATTGSGKYGYNPSLLFAEKLEGEWSGETAEFYVGGTKAITASPVTLSRGGYTRLDLNVLKSVGSITKTESDVITDQQTSITASSPTIINMGSSLNVQVSSDTSTTATISKVEKLNSDFFTGNTAILSGQNLLNAYEIKINGTGLSISVMMKYDDTGIDESTVKPYKYNGTEWIAITPFTRDTTANTLTFSMLAANTPYVLFGQKTPIQSSGGGGGSSNPVVVTVGDMNGDAKVNKYDFALMMSNWGKTGTNVADLNNDNVVNKYDFALLMARWSTS
ncbi:MAG: dockerin type I domain-containing protein [Candidatus Parcubacteria bacterium]|nr:dockerin type I domain-containing protein [Candidatus Parcubacteria bacterium]